MKLVLMAVCGLGLVAGAAFLLARPGALTVREANPADNGAQEVVACERTPVVSPSKEMTPTPVVKPVSKAVAASAPAVESMDPAAASNAVNLLISPQVAYEQKQSVWKQLRESGGLDLAISDLQQRLANFPNSPECAAVLGHACLQKCGTISDVREQGILAMQADKLFDTALTLDPANWEARFNKAVALSYWPASMGKSEEVISHFLTLVQQQETQPTQPQFADTYVWLGDQYQKVGKPEDAQLVWSRGVTLFPENQKLAGRLASIR